jgi:anti-sigma factor RsiW
LLGSYLDGELDAPWMIDIESHVASCAACKEQTDLLRATKTSLKRSVRRPAPEGLRNRVQVAMLAEAARAEVREAQVERSASKSFTWRSMVPLATAAAIALAYGATKSNGSRSTEQMAGFGDDLLQELIAEHAQPLPPEATDAKSVRGLEQYVGVPVRPGSFERAGAKLVGGRILPVRSSRAAILQYVMMNGDEPRRVSVVIYDPSKISVNAGDFAPRAIGTARVQVGQQKGYSVAVMQRAGVGYALATDMDADRSAQFAAHVYDE